MNWRAFGAIAAMVVAAPLVARAQTTMTVRTYNNFGVSAEDLSAARPHVEAVFRDAGIELSWVDCWYRDKEIAGTSAHCSEPLKTNEMILRLQAANPLPGRRYVSMGFALVNIAEGVPFLATVYADLVRTVSRDAHLDYQLLLGRAIAHEIGHLLLDTNRHAETGLMRADWSHAELRANAGRDWSFAAGEKATIRSAAGLRQPSKVAQGFSPVLVAAGGQD
jgi:hypothetical protein